MKRVSTQILSDIEYPTVLEKRYNNKNLVQKKKLFHYLSILHFKF